MKKMSVWYAVSGVLLLMGGIGLILTNIMENPLIIRFGVRAVVMVNRISTGLSLLGAIVLASASVPNVMARMENRRKQKHEQDHQKQAKQIIANYAKDGATPELIRQSFEHLCCEIPCFLKPVKLCLEQMDIMDELQAKQSRLIMMNDAQYLRQTEAVLDGVERRICRNMQSMINLFLAAGSYDNLNTDKIKALFSDNSKRLDDVQELIDLSADWINHYNDGKKRESTELEDWITTIQESLKEE